MGSFSPGFGAAKGFAAQMISLLLTRLFDQANGCSDMRHNAGSC
jgi:hypothetical protein